MWFLRVILAGVACISLAYGGSAALAGMVPAQKPVAGAKVERPKKDKELGKAPAAVSRLRKATQFVKKVEGGVLYTEGGRYSLSGVQVVDLTEGREDVGTKSTPKKTAEMTFFNNRLYEVVIRQRR